MSSITTSTVFENTLKLESLLQLQMKSVPLERDLEFSVFGLIVLPGGNLWAKTLTLGLGTMMCFSLCDISVWELNAQYRAAAAAGLLDLPLLEGIPCPRGNCSPNIFSHATLSAEPQSRQQGLSRRRQSPHASCPHLGLSLNSG